MLRGFTHGISRAHLEATLSKSIVLGKPCHASEPDSTEPPNTMMIPHPKAILLGILEDFQVERRKEINGYFKKLESIESSIKQERSTNKQKKYGLAVCSTQLSETNVSLSQVRPKLQYLATSIKTLESCNDIPDCKGDLAFDYFSNADRSNHTFPHDHYSQVWTRQLGNIKRRLACLKVKCDQCRSDVETLQYRLTGNLSVVG